MKDKLRKVKELEERNALLENALAESELDRYVRQRHHLPAFPVAVLLPRAGDRSVQPSQVAS